MPRSKKQDRKQFDLKGFVPCNLGKQEKQDAQQWIAANAGEFFTLLEKIVGDGYKFSVSLDRFHDCFSSSLTCTDPDNSNIGWCLSGRAPDAWSAVGMVLYKHLVVLDGVWDTREPSGDRDDKWG